MNATSLKNSILQLAVSGKLVPQCATDEPASELLSRIRKKREDLIATKKIKNTKIDPITSDEIPFEIPDTWEWVRLGEVCTHIVDGDHNPPPNSGKGIPIFSAVNVHDNKLNFNEATRWITEEQFEKHKKRISSRSGVVLLTIVGTIGRTAVIENEEPFALQRSVCVIGQIDMDPIYVAMYLESISNYLESISSGTAQKGVYLGTLKNLLLPLPPLPEQHRIVEKVEELMPLVRDFGKLEEERQELDENLPKALKASVLQQAVQGKLVPQCDVDEPASELLKRIRKKREEFIAAKKIKNTKIAPIREDEIPFEIPKSWEWMRLGEIAQINGGYAFKSSEYKRNGTRVIRISDFNESGFINKDTVRYEYNNTLEPYLLQSDDIIMCMTGGTVGKTLYVYSLSEPMLVNQRVATIRKQCEINPVYLYNVLTSETIQKIIHESKNSTNDNISMTTISNFLIPLPPLPEQHRIVEKVREVMLCL